MPCEINILSSKNYEQIKQNIIRSNPMFKNIAINHETFPDGEHYYRILSSEQIAGRPAVFICGTTSDQAILEAYNIGCTLVREGCSSLHLVIPYFGYSTMERAIKSGEAVTAKNIARLFSSLPLSATGNYIYMIDLHSLGTQYYFEQNIHPVHLTSEPVIDQMIADIRQETPNVVLASADMGRAKWIEKMSNRLGLEGAYIMKKRINGEKTIVEALNADVKNKNIIIFDDMIRSGSSIINAAKAYKSIGAEKIYVACVHGVFVNDAIEKMYQSNVITNIYTTNTHPSALTAQQHSHTRPIALSEKECQPEETSKNSYVKIYDISSVITHGLKL